MAMLVYQRVRLGMAKSHPHLPDVRGKVCNHPELFEPRCAAAWRGWAGCFLEPQMDRTWKKRVVLKNQLRCNVGILFFFTTIVNTHVYFWLSGIAGYDENLSAIYGYMSPVFTDFPASNV